MSTRSILHLTTLIVYRYANYSRVPEVADGADGHGAFGTNGGHQAAGGCPRALLLILACHGE